MNSAELFPLNRQAQAGCGATDGMGQKVIFPENVIGEDKDCFLRLMALVPPRERSDAKLKRFLIFRMKIDGEETTREYLLKGIELSRERAFKGSLYEYLSDGGGGWPENVLDDTPPDEFG